MLHVYNAAYLKCCTLHAACCVLHAACCMVYAVTIESNPPARLLWTAQHSSARRSEAYERPLIAVLLLEVLHRCAARAQLVVCVAHRSFAAVARRAEVVVRHVVAVRHKVPVRVPAVGGRSASLM